MITKKFASRISAVLTAGAFAFSIMSATPSAEAFSLGSIGDIANAGAKAITAGKQGAVIKKELKKYNTTEEGRQQLFAEYKAKYGVNDDPEFNYRVDGLMKNLSAAVAKVDPTINEKPYLYFINKQESINAFCSLGHVMSINTGLLNLFPNDDEVAVVVGHEMGHGQKDHPYSGSVRKIDSTVVAQVGVAATGSGLASNVLGSIVLNQTNAHGTKAQEKEADNLAFEYLTNSDYNPGACAAVWQRFLDKQGNNAQNALGSIFAPSDHPNNAARRDTYVKLLETYGNKKVTAQDGTVKVNGKAFMTAADHGDMSGKERSYFILGNLAKAYHNGQDKMAASVANGTVMLGSQSIVKPISGEPSAETLAETLNSIK